MNDARIIKFRAFDKSTNKIFIPSIISAKDGSVYATDRDYEDGINCNNCPLMQFTGLKDTNGVDIYEGDIIEIEGATAKVVFWERPPEFGLDYDHNESEWCEDWNLTDDCDRMEVIGNIYQNQI